MVGVRQQRMCRRVACSTLLLVDQLVRGLQMHAGLLHV